MLCPDHLLPSRLVCASARRRGTAPSALVDPAALMQLQMAQRKPEIRWLAGAPRLELRWWQACCCCALAYWGQHPFLQFCVWFLHANVS